MHTHEQITACIFDWAGTTVDFGCFAPLHVFLEIFKRRGIDITVEEARGPMGMLKIDHVRALCSLPRVALLWRERFGALPNEPDVASLYADFEPALYSLLPDYATPIPGVPSVVRTLRDRGIAIGSTTGYTRAMMDIVAPAAALAGYAPDCIVAADEVPAGRPAPWMIFRVCEQLKTFPMHRVVKIGDTVADIGEGVNASAWSVGVIVGSSEMGLTAHDYEQLDPAEKIEVCTVVKNRFLSHGAHFVIDTMEELPELVDTINGLLAQGVRPATYSTRSTDGVTKESVS